MGLSTEVNAFSGGMNNVTAPYLIAKDEAVLLVNVDIRRGSMWSMPRREVIKTVIEPFFYQFGGTIYEYTSWRSNVLWDNRWYWSDGAFTGKVLQDGTEKDLGLASPTTAPAASAAGVGPHTGEFKYCYTFYDEDTGVESAPSPLTPYVTANDNNITISGKQDLPADATHWRIYRIGGYLPYLMLVAKTDLVSYEDTLDDTQIDGRNLRTLRNGPPPAGLNFLTEMNGRMYGAVGNNVLYSALGNPDSWYIYDLIPCQGRITGLAKLPGGLMVMGLDWSNILKGSNPFNFVLKVISDKVGMTSMASLAYIDQSAIWLARHGLVISNGFTIKQLTSDKIDDIGGLAAVGAASLNNVYYMAFKPSLFPSTELYPSEELYPARVQGTAGVGQGVISVDFKRGKGYSYRIIDEPQVLSLDKINGFIAITTGAEVDILFPTCGDVAFPNCYDYVPCGTDRELNYIDKYDAGNGTDIPATQVAPIEYISPLFVDGSTTTLKQYDKVRIVFKGFFTIHVLFDNDRLVVSRDIESDGEGRDFDFALLGIPNDDNNSYSIRFVVQGIGIVKGIQYSYKYRGII